MTSNLESLALDGLQLNDGATTFGLESLDIPPAEKKLMWAEAADADGEALVEEPHYRNRKVTAKVRVVRQADMDTALAKIALLTDKLGKAEQTEGGIPLVWTPADATKSFTLYVLSGEIEGLPVEVSGEAGWFVKAPILTLRLDCRPFGYGAEVTPAVTSRTNLVTNPKAQIDATGWTNASLTTHARVTLPQSSPATLTSLPNQGAFTAMHGIGDADVDRSYASVAVTSGLTYRFSAYVYLDTNTATGVRLQVRNASDTVKATSTTLSTLDAWTRLDVSVTADATATWRFAVEQVGAGATDFYWTAVLVEQSASLGPYFDGDSPGSSWTTGPHSSTSTERSNGFTASTLPQSEFVIPSVAGDVPAEARLIVTDAATQNRDFVEWGLDASPKHGAPLIIDSDQLVTTGFQGTQTTRTGAHNPDASGNSVVRTAVLEDWFTACGSGDLRHAGTFRVRGRFYSTADTGKARLAYRIGDGLLTTLGEVDLLAAQWTERDLGMVHIPAVTLGQQRWEMQVQTMGVTGQDVDIDFLRLIPAGRYGKATAPAVSEVPLVTLAHDEFLHTAGDLTGKVAPQGGTWAEAGDADGFTIDTTNKLAQRTAVSDSAGTPNLQLLGTGVYAYTNLRARLFHNGLPGVPAQTQKLGLLARYVDVSNYLIGFYGTSYAAGIYSLSLYVFKVVAGAGTQLAFKNIYNSGAKFGINRTLQIDIDTAGNVGVLEGQAGLPLTFQFWVNDPVLATGGALDDGRVGLYDEWTGSGAMTRTADNILLWSGGSTAGGIVLNSTKQIEFRHNDTLRQDSTGLLWGRPPSYRGSRFFIPQSGEAGRIPRVAVAAKRNDVDDAGLPDDQIADALTAQISYVPRFTTAPR